MTPPPAILTSHGFPPALVAPFTIVTSLMDMTIGVLIAFRRTCAAGLIAGIVVSLGYMVGTAILTPDLWIEPLGALVKTGPAIVLMLVALLTLDNQMKTMRLAGRRRDPLRRRLRVLLALDPLRRRARRERSAFASPRSSPTTARGWRRRSASIPTIPTPTP